MQVTNCTKAKEITLSLEEYVTIKEAMETLSELQAALGTENTITSLETGECICPGELARARGILDFVATHRMVEVH